MKQTILILLLSFAVSLGKAQEAQYTIIESNEEFTVVRFFNQDKTDSITARRSKSGWSKRWIQKVLTLK